MPQGGEHRALEAAGQEVTPRRPAAIIDAVKSRVLVLPVVLLTLACGGDTVTTVPEALEDCSVAGRNGFVRDTLQDIYLWYREIPDPDPASFPSPEAYLEAVRYRTFDSHFSYVANREASQAFFSDSQFVGFGFRWTLAAADDLRVIDVYAGSPAAEAGLERGARMLEINGQRVGDLVAAGQLGAVFGPADVGVTAQVRFLDRSGAERASSMIKRVVTIPTVAVVRTIPFGDRRVGYVLFENFVTPSTPALDDAFERLRAEGANELVLDMRYNGGGLVSVARHLAGLIGGDRTRGKVFVRFAHNDKNTRRDSQHELTAPPQALNLSRLVAITTDASASASELIVNGLRPFMEVTVVGERTFGKPVGQYGFDFCDQTLFPVAFKTVNARNEGEYFGGLPADCAAPDDFGRELGDPQEGSLAEALQFLRNGRCSATAAASAHALSRRKPARELQPHRTSGWQTLLGSY